MKKSFAALCLFTAISSVSAQSPVNRSGSTVVAIIDTKPVTIDDLTALATATGNVDQFHTNPREFLEYYALCQRLLAYAEANQLEKRQDIRAQQETLTKQLLMKAAFDWYGRHVSIAASAIEDYHKQHASDFIDKTKQPPAQRPLADVTEQIRTLLQHQATEKWAESLQKSISIVGSHQN